MSSVPSVPQYEFLAAQCEEQAKRAKVPEQAADFMHRAARWRHLAAARVAGDFTDAHFVSTARRQMKIKEEAHE
jgi:hypothetical protein